MKTKRKTKTKPKLDPYNQEGKIFPPITLKISRRIWLRGTPNKSFLLRHDGKMCCVGIAARKCGIHKRDLLNRTVLEDLFPRLRAGTGRLLSRAYNDNDCDEITEPTRERNVREALKALGFKAVVFTK